MKDPYFNLKAISNSALSQFKKSPKHYLHSLANPIKPTDDMNLGSLIHCLSFEPKMFSEYFLLIDDEQKPFPAADYRNAQNREWKAGMERKAFQQELLLVDGEMLKRAKKAKEALWNDPVAGPLLEYKGNVFESIVAWTKGKSTCKGKIDIRNDYYLADLKTTRDAEPFSFQRLIFDRDIHRQLGMYLDGDAEGHLTVEDLKEAYVIAQENNEPYGTSVHRLTPEVILQGYNQYLMLLEQMQMCIDTNVWEGYSFKSGIQSEGIFNVEPRKEWN